VISASSAVRTSSTSKYIWSGITRSLRNFKACGDFFGLSFRELDVDGRPSVIPTTTPTQFDPAAMHASVDRILACRPEALYLTHFSRVTDLPRLGDDLHRLIEAHIAVAEQERDAGPERGARILNGLWALMDAEAVRQGWRLDAEQRREVLGMDIELNAQGLDYWLDQRPLPA
jgi:hydroxyacylglutathione hydrolase